MPILHSAAIDLIRDVAAVPSFSSYEERLHPLVERVAATIPGAVLHHVPDRNLVIEVPGDPNLPLVAITAHLDKINHLGHDSTDALPVTERMGYLEGQLDDAVGVGMALAVAMNPRGHHYPPLLILLSEMEESWALKKTPHLLRNNGEGLHHGIGAQRIARFLIREGKLPNVCITLDTTPLFGGTPGVALYSAHWEINRMEASTGERLKTEALRKKFQEICPDILISNNTNDYLQYGKVFAEEAGRPIASVALEPAIFPYHQTGERVYLRDIRLVVDILDAYLSA